LKEGEKLSLEELLYGVMLASGNDASIAVAEHVAGSVEEFSKLMNQKAKEMGAKNSHFNNPHGLPDVNHYTTAYDMGMIMRYALKNKDFVKITTTKHKTISWADNDWGRGLRNHNKLLWSYDDITGGKTGYTRAAGRCLVASAKKDGREVAAVVLNDSHDWLDVRNLLDHGLNDFKMIRVINKGDEIYKLDWEDSLEEKLIMRAEKPITLVIPRGKKINVKKKIVLKKKLALPIKKGDIVGYIQFSDEYKQLISVNLVAENDLNYRSIFLRFWHWLTS
ncbi:MAG: D-alanyl-D-alanine carboxypeptidase family protein, partial [bacterium]